MDGMLVLARKPGESIYIEGVGLITFLENRGHVIRLGLNVDRQFRISRVEDDPADFIASKTRQAVPV